MRRVSNSLGAVSGIVRRILYKLEPFSLAIAASLLGWAGGWFGLAAGFLLGFMADIARVEARERGSLARFFEAPFAPKARRRSPLFQSRADDAVYAFAAFSCLALRGDWPGPADSRLRRNLWKRICGQDESLAPLFSAWGERVGDVAQREAGADMAALMRYLASLDGSSRAFEVLSLPALKAALGTLAFSLAALGSAELSARAELGLRASLADCGLSGETIQKSRSLVFPGFKDPWAVLGLCPGAGRTEIRRAYRSLSRLFHPDRFPQDGGERFREIAAAYEKLSR